MDARKDPKIIADLHRMLQSLVERSARLLSLIDKWDPLHAAAKGVDDDIRKVVPMVRVLIPPPDTASIAFDSGHRFSVPNKGTILYIDDKTDRLTLLRSMLEIHDYRVLTAEYGRKGLELFLSEPVELVLLDFHMPGMNGDEVAGKMSMLSAQVPIVLLFCLVRVTDTVMDDFARLLFTYYAH